MYKFKAKYFYMKVAEESAVKLMTPEVVINLVKDDFDYNEKMIVLGLNIKNKMLIKKVISIGTHNCIMCTPADIFIPLLKTNARSFILVHNHPSDDPSPSPEDIIFTKKIEKASSIVGLSLLDHIILAHNDSYSLKKNRLI